MSVRTAAQALLEAWESGDLDGVSTQRYMHSIRAALSETEGE